MEKKLKAISENKLTGTPARRKAGWCEEGGGRRMPDGGVPPLAVNFLGSLHLPSQPLVFLQMLGQGVEVGALLGLGPEDAQRLKGRAARGRQRCCRASGGCADCRRSGRRAQEGNPSGAAAPAPLTQGSQRDGARSLPLHRGAKETATEASPVYPKGERSEPGGQAFWRKS